MTKSIIKLLTLVFLLANSVMFIWTFLSAYAQPDYRVIVDINSYGEANFEMMVILLFTPVALLGVKYILEDTHVKMPKMWRRRVR